MNYLIEKSEEGIKGVVYIGNDKYKAIEKLKNLRIDAFLKLEEDIIYDLVQDTENKYPTLKDIKIKNYNESYFKVKVTIPMKNLEWFFYTKSKKLEAVKIKEITLSNEYKEMEMNKEELKNDIALVTCYIPVEQIVNEFNVNIFSSLRETVFLNFKKFLSSSNIKLEYK